MSECGKVRFPRCIIFYSLNERPIGRQLRRRGLGSAPLNRGSRISPKSSELLRSLVSLRPSLSLLMAVVERAFIIDSLSECEAVGTGTFSFETENIAQLIIFRVSSKRTLQQTHQTHQTKPHRYNK